MKWLAPFLCLLALSPAVAEQPEIPQPIPPEKKVITLPALVQCSEAPPDEMLHNLYGEEVFVFGKGAIFGPSGQLIQGQMRMFVSPNEKTYTVMIEVAGLHCMVISGDIKIMFPPEKEL